MRNARGLTQHRYRQPFPKDDYRTLQNDRGLTIFLKCSFGEPEIPTCTWYHTSFLFYLHIHWATAFKSESHKSTSKPHPVEKEKTFTVTFTIHINSLKFSTTRSCSQPFGPHCWDHLSLWSLGALNRSFLRGMVSVSVSVFKSVCMGRFGEIVLKIPWKNTSSYWYRMKYDSKSHRLKFIKILSRVVPRHYSMLFYFVDVKCIKHLFGLLPYRMNVYTIL